MRSTSILTVIWLIPLLVVGLACNNGESIKATKQQISQPGKSPIPSGESSSLDSNTSLIVSANFPTTSEKPVDTVGQGSISEPARMPSDKSLRPTASVINDSDQGLLQITGAQTGIWVTGEGSMSLEPDLAMINIEVATMDDTLAEAHDQAATDMSKIMTVLNTYGIAEKDIQTKSFNIWPQYEYPEIREKGQRTHKQVLVGYRISNSARIMVRDIRDIGLIIDNVVDAGGNSTRINGIEFTIENPKPFMATLRKEAVEDALAKAQQFADLTNVVKGRLTFISESGSGIPMPKSVDMMGMEMRSAAAAPTSISGGELELKLNVQAVFEIH